MSWILTISFFILFLYMYLISGFWFHWIRSSEFIPGSEEGTFISVVIPMFDESGKLQKLVGNLKDQIYPVDKFEVILVDDHSTDNSYTMAEEMCGKLENFRVIRNVALKGKKHALKTGISQARGNFILISDADCRFSPQWVSLFGKYFSLNPGLALVSSGVIMQGGNSFHEKFQSLEFSSLVASGAASFIQKDPVMCNGANLAFRKDLFLEAFHHIYPGVNTGDDMFLMLYSKKKYPGQISFLKNRFAFTETFAKTHWSSFLRQRVRWASKSNLYRDFRLIYISIIVLFVNLLLIFLFTVSLFHHIYIVYFCIFFFLKSGLDYFFLNSFLRYSGQEKLMKFFIPSQLINLLFIPLTGMLGILLPTTGTRNR